MTEAATCNIREDWRPRLIIFDLDDTLIQEAGTDALIIQELAEKDLAVSETSAKTLIDAVHRNARSLWQQSGEIEYCRRIGTSSIEGLYGDYSGDNLHLAALRRYIDESRYRERVWEMALGELGVADPKLALTFAEAFRARRNQRHLAFPDALPALQRLACSYRFAMITNGVPRVQRTKLEGSGFAGFFDVTVVSGEFGIGKPDPSIFAHTLSLVGLPAESAIMVGNSLGSDVAGANRAGLRSVWVNRLAEPRPIDVHPDVIVSTLDELYPTL